MNGSTEVRSNSSTPSPEQNQQKTDTPLPLDTPVQEVSAGQPRPRASADRVISGIDLIDFGAGGLMPQHVYVVKGGSGVGKSLVGLQFLVRGLDHEEPGILITDQKPQNVIAQAKSIGFPIEEAIKRNQLAILNPSSRYFDLVESPADILAIVEELGDYINTFGARRLVIDPIFTLINTSYSSHFALTITQSLLNALEDLPATTLLVTGDEDNADLNPIIRALEQNAFGIIALTHDAATGGRVMKLTKLRYAGTDNLTAHYRILDGRGIINYRGEGEHVADVTKPWEETAQVSRKVFILGAQPETISRVKEALGDRYEVSAESDLKAGIERVKRERPGLVLVTPSRSAGAVNAILDLAQNSTSSIAFISPFNRKADRVLYLRAGADDFITEPFNAHELRARVDALIRRSGRRLNVRDSAIGAISPDEISALLQRDDFDSTAARKRGPVLHLKDDCVDCNPEFRDRLQRNIDTVSKFDQPFALYWIKAQDDDRELNRALAQLARQEDVVCHNRNGEFVCILTGADESAVKGFETRMNDKLGDRLDPNRVRRGYSLHQPGDVPAELFAAAPSS